ncbi:uncharacterized protein LOC135167953 [Diachasmimorpha longicaudata]|uniref:uncharacterized protein LOC135167953 n=1 Tax=Diachasmimorpha longicaudata TaxID=58733 RepID=UPI0030B87055
MKKNLEDLWAEDARRSLRIYKIIAGIMGVWPFTCQQTFSKIRFTSLIIILMSLITMLAVDLLIRSDNINATLESVVFGLSGFLGIVKITLPRIYWRHIESILISTAHDWSTTTSPKFREIVNKSSLIGTASFVLLLGGSLLISGLFGLYKVTLNLRVTSRNLTGQHVLFGAGYWTSNLPLMEMTPVTATLSATSADSLKYCQ